MIFKGIQFTIGSDAHDRSRIGDVDILYSFLKDLNGLENLINWKKLTKPSQ
ncbi:MAG: hypothetical protein GF329_00705 [Candidatus Lokiarchaeota archaeon]|nr:hypothetical protein [Candidatus Lokiarchaeota archaeon]